MRASLKKLRGFALHRNGEARERSGRHTEARERSERRLQQPVPQLDELSRASQNNVKMALKVYFWFQRVSHLGPWRIRACGADARHQMALVIREERVSK
ncbi:hypothetical protein Acr_29g0002450 [Actinidia rufa]|uniref:Uncharacterized protein n=1 Tax=Actinidia rufa TaxID=165716 RepID=A0A7J0HD92_9ERIC|nr:hypothetical protein Acr_29g0002450 [Actinidia rufa]